MSYICRSCSGRVREVLDLGAQVPSNLLSSQQHYPLRAGVCESCWLMQTMYDVPHKELFTDDYPYFSGQSREWVRHCYAYAYDITKRLHLGSESLVVEIGGNDGTLLREFEHADTLNVEPCLSVATVSRQAGIATIQRDWETVTLERKADLIVANNVMAHTPRLNEFVAAIKRNLARRGVVTIEFPWARHLVEQCQFDTIYHEHYSYLSYTALEGLFARHGLWIYDADILETHGGSLRIYATHGDHVEDGPPHQRQANRIQLDTIYAAEDSLRGWATYDLFAARARGIRTMFNSWLRSLSGPTMAYGAAAKGAVFLQYCGVTEKDISCVGDTTPAKQGKLMPGTHIPIVSEEAIVEARPTELLLLAWNWKREIIAKLRPRMPKTTFIIAIPELTMSQSYTPGTPIG